MGVCSPERGVSLARLRLRDALCPDPLWCVPPWATLRGDTQPGASSLSLHRTSGDLHTNQFCLSGCVSYTRTQFGHRLLGLGLQAGGSQDPPRV